MTGFAPITAKIIADSINPVGNRLTTWELTYPRFIHAELLTHRSMSRNSASSRAIPTSKLRQRVVDAPAGHEFWGANQKGMQALGEIDDVTAAQEWWAAAAASAVKHHTAGEQLGLHKQIVNRIIEPWMMITVIVSATEWANFFHLRNHPDAEPNFQKLAKTMWDVYTTSLPTLMGRGGWHLPYITAEDEDALVDSVDDVGLLARKISVGRCARVSYLTHDGKRDLNEDVALHDKLVGTFDAGNPGHFSPFEHVAMAHDTSRAFANFRGWQQYRTQFNRESGPNIVTRCKRCGLWNGQHVTGCEAAS